METAHRLAPSLAIVPAVDDLGSPSSYLVLEPGIDVFSRDGERLGEVQHVLADPEVDLFDGIVIDTSGLPGGLRFADALQVAEIYERGVILDLSHAEAEQLPEPSENPGSIEVTGVEDVDRSELHEKLRRAWDIISGKG
jgi:PRC-barrel domain